MVAAPSGVFPFWSVFNETIVNAVTVTSGSTADRTGRSGAIAFLGAFFVPIVFFVV